jgi:Protein of unknown function (DUF2905)
MLRWMLIFLLAMLVFNGIRPWLEKVGLGRLPGDLHFRFRGRDWYFPIASSLVLSGIALGIGLLI